MTDRKPIGIRQFGSNGSGREVQIRKSFRGANNRARGSGGLLLACVTVRVPVNNKFAVTRYKYQGSIGY